jgi:hypothetical protein
LQMDIKRPGIMLSSVIDLSNLACLYICQANLLMALRSRHVHQRCSSQLQQ